MRGPKSASFKSAQRPSQIIDAALEAFKDEAAKSVEANYVAISSSGKEFEHFLKKHVKMAETRSVAEADTLSGLKQMLNEAKSGIKSLHAVEQAAASELGAVG